MINVRIVCAHDAVDTAKRIMRLLEAEGHAVKLCFGRANLSQMQAAKDSAEAVLVIWSVNAASAHYMHHAAMQAPAQRLIEIARAPGWPSLDHRRHQPIDFTRWNGERGGLDLRNPWRELEERLRGVARAFEPPRPQPTRAAMAMGAAGMVALGAAAVMRVDNETRALPELEDQRVSYATVEEVIADARGGPLLTPVEPFSAPDEEDAFGPYVRRARMLEGPAPLDLAPMTPLEDMVEGQSFRDQSLLARLASSSGQRRSEP